MANYTADLEHHEPSPNSLRNYVALARALSQNNFKWSEFGWTREEDGATMADDALWELIGNWPGLVSWAIKAIEHGASGFTVVVDHRNGETSLTLKPDGLLESVAKASS